MRADTLATAGPLLFLKHDRIENQSWAAFAEALGLEHGDPVQVLAEIGSSGTPTLFVDGIDRFDPAHKGVVVDIIRAIESSEHLDHWTVLATSRDQGLEGYRIWFPVSFYRETGIGDVRVPPFDESEAAQLAHAAHALSSPLLGPGNVAEVARRPFFAAVLARSGATRGATPQTEIDLVGAWWRGGGHDGPHSSVVQRQRALFDVAEQGLRTLGRRVPTRDLRESTLSQIEGLVDDGLLKSIDDGARYSFAHDIFFEWVFFRRLVELEEDWTDELVRTGEPPLLGRVVGLLAQKALEVAGGWSNGYRRLESMDLRLQWRREWLTAPPLTSAFSSRQAEFARFLAENDHRLLGKFLLWFQAHHTTPNPEVLASETLPQEADRTRFADLLGWPSDIAGWARLLGWLILAAPKFPKRFAPDIVQVFFVWQNAFARTKNPHSAATVELCSRWLVELEDGLYGPPDRPMRATDWSDLDSNGEDLATNLRLTIARSASTYPAPMRELYERAVLSGDTRQNTYAELMAFSLTAADVCPEVLAAVAKAELMEELPKDRVERRRKEQETVLAALRRIREKPEAERTPAEQRAVSRPYPFFGEDRVDPDDIGIKQHEPYYYPPSPKHQPFAALFGTAPETAVALVRDLTNHAVEGWRQNEELHSTDTPVPVTLRFPCREDCLSNSAGVLSSWWTRCSPCPAWTTSRCSQSWASSGPASCWRRRVWPSSPTSPAPCRTPSWPTSAVSASSRWPEPMPGRWCGSWARTGCPRTTSPPCRCTTATSEPRWARSGSPPSRWRSGLLRPETPMSPSASAPPHPHTSHLPTRSRRSRPRTASWWRSTGRGSRLSRKGKVLQLTRRTTLLKTRSGAPGAASITRPAEPQERRR